VGRREERDPHPTLPQTHTGFGWCFWEQRRGWLPASALLWQAQEGRGLSHHQERDCGGRE